MAVPGATRRRSGRADPLTAIPPSFICIMSAAVIELQFLSHEHGKLVFFVIARARHVYILLISFLESYSSCTAITSHI